VDRPFYSLEDKRGVSFLFDYRNERVLQYFDGITTAGDSLRRRYLLAGIEAAKAIKKSTSGYLRIGLNGQIRRDDYTTWPGDPNYGGITGTIGAFVEARKANFAITRGFRSFGQDEDIDLSNFVRLGVYAAPKLFGYDDQSGVGGLLQVRLGTQLPFGFAWFDGRANGPPRQRGPRLRLGGRRRHVGDPADGEADVDPPRRCRLAEGSHPRLRVRSGLRGRTAGLPDPRVHRRPDLLHDRRVPADLR
jgi:hypothetical protein